MMDSKKAADLAYAEGYRLGAASRDAEVQRLQSALADAEALELGTAERCDQLRASVLKLVGTLLGATNYIDMLGGTSVEYRKALATTPEQSLAEYRAKITKAGEVMRERCIEIADCSAIRTLPAVTLEDLT